MPGLILPGTIEFLVRGVTTYIKIAGGQALWRHWGNSEKMEQFKGWGVQKEAFNVMLKMDLSDQLVSSLAND